MHQWGDSFKYFAEVGEAAEFIGDYCRKYGRIGVTQTKEKYGTARVYCHFGWHQLFSITHPGYVYSRYPKWLWNFDCMYLSKIIRPLNKLTVSYQIRIYRRAYELAFKKWPLIKEEIISGADYAELISEYFAAIPACEKHREEIQYSRISYNNKDCAVCDAEKHE